MKTAEIYLSEIAKTPVLDIATFDIFCELMEDLTEGIITKHFEVADGYIKTILEASEARNFKVMEAASHPLKSSSQQIGAYRLADIAKNIEAISASPAPDISLLKTLAQYATVEYKQTKQLIMTELEKRKM